MDKDKLRTKENLGESKVAVFNELDRLQEVVVWGEPSCEALLGQLLPLKESLFFSRYNVAEARIEHARMQAMIETHGVKVLRFKDIYADMLMQSSLPAGAPQDVAELSARIKERGWELYRLYETDIHEEEKFGREIVNPEEVLSNVQNLIDSDVAKYGVGKAIRLNYELSLAQEKPIANIIFARDQSNALGDKIVMSNMRWGIRKPEVAIYRSIYEYLGFGENLVDVTEGTFEGGDAMIVDGICYIGVGARTSMEAVEEVARKIGEGLNDNGISIVAVVNEKHAKESAMYKSPTDEHMSVMHLDTFWGPLATGLSLGLSSEIDKRKIFVLKNNSRGVEKTEVCNFGDFLRLRNETELLAILPEEQESYASNFLNMGNGTIISPLEKNIRVKEMIEKNGVVKVESPNISQLVGGYGAVHCMTASIKRG